MLSAETCVLLLMLPSLDVMLVTSTGLPTVLPSVVLGVVKVTVVVVPAVMAATVMVVAATVVVVAATIVVLAAVAVPLAVDLVRSL